MSTPTPETDAEQLRKVLRKQSRCIYIAVESSVADPIAAAMNMAASMLEDLETRLRAAEAERDEKHAALEGVLQSLQSFGFNRGDIVAIWLRQELAERDTLKARVEELERKLESHVAVYNSLFDEAKKMQRKLADYERPVEGKVQAALDALTPLREFENLSRERKDAAFQLGQGEAGRILARAYRQQAKENAVHFNRAFELAAELQAVADALGVPYSSGAKVLELVKEQAAKLADTQQALEITTRSADDQMQQKREAQQQLAQFEGAEISHQKQPTPTSCVAACVAMVAGINVDAVLREFPNPVGGEGLRKMLDHYGVKWHFDGLGCSLEPGKCYIAVVPSLNLKGSNHQIVIDVRGGVGKVYDPNEGREDKCFYTYPESNRPLAFTLQTWTDLIEVQPLARSVIFLPKPGAEGGASS